MKDILTELNDRLSNQQFDHSDGSLLNRYLMTASDYATIEDSTAVLSDLRENRSYIFHGTASERAGIAVGGTTQTVDSIWEDNILSHIHSDDLRRKYSMELYFFQFIQDTDNSRRRHFHIRSTMRMIDRDGKYIYVQHRMFYLYGNNGNDTRFALCLYDLIGECELTSVIIDTTTGQTVYTGQDTVSSLLSEREKEILRLITHGLASKEIADRLNISIHTVNRHRQNIIEKLHVRNSIEAAQVAKLTYIV